MSSSSLTVFETIHRMLSSDFRETQLVLRIVFVQKGKTHRADCGSSEGAGRGKRERTPAPHRKGALRNGVTGHPSETIPFLSGVRDPYT